MLYGLQLLPPPTNGSAFAGLSANTIFFNLTLALAMLCGRFLVIVPVLAIAGSLAAKVKVPVSAGTLPTDGIQFVFLIVGTVLILGGSHLLPGARARSSCRALFRVPAALILPMCGPSVSRLRFNRVSIWPFISRLFRGGLSHLEFICRNGYVIGTVPSPSKGFEKSTALDSRS